MEEASHIPMAAPPTPRVSEEELLDWEESSTPPCCRDLYEVQRRVQERLRRMAGLADDVASSSFQRRLALHLQRMPPRYLVDVDTDDKAEDVLLHWRILEECADPDKRPVFHARHVKVRKKMLLACLKQSIEVPARYNGSDEEELEKTRQWLAKGLNLERKAVDDNDSRITSSRYFLA